VIRAALFASAAALLAVPAAGAGDLDRTRFRYERGVRPTAGGPAEIVADGPLFAHARPGFADVRVVDGDGAQVPWRMLPAPPEEPDRRVPVLDAGRRGGRATALLDLGPGRAVHDRVDLELPGRGFVGRVTVEGSDDRRAFTWLSTTTVYDLDGGRPARSTAVVFPPSDFRYLRLTGTGVRRIDGAVVSAGSMPEPRLVPVPTRASTRTNGDTTVVRLDLGHRRVPVDELVVTSSSPRYDREVEVTGGGFSYGRIVRHGLVRITRLPVHVDGRSVQVRIENGDDEALAGLRVVALARPRTLLVEGGHPAPLTLLYGAAVAAPRYDLALVPRRELDLGHARRAELGGERRNPEFAVRDTRSFVARHRGLVEAALVLAAAAVALAGVLALRRA
jgi:hypothetical protein